PESGKTRQGADNGRRTASFLRLSICAKSEQVYTQVRTLENKSYRPFTQEKVAGCAIAHPGIQRFGSARLSKNSTAEQTTIDGPAGVSLNQDRARPPHTAVTPSRLAPRAICSGERA